MYLQVKYPNGKTEAKGEGRLDVVDCVRQTACRSSQPSGQLCCCERNLAASLPAGPPAAPPTAPGDGAALERAVVKVIKPEIISSASSHSGITAEWSGWGRADFKSCQCHLLVGCSFGQATFLLCAKVPFSVKGR